MTTIHLPPSPVDDKPSPPEGVEAEVLYEDFVAYMSNKLSPSVSNAIMLAALQQHVFAQHIVGDHLARVARRRKGRIDSDKTRMAAHGQIVDVDWPNVPVKQSIAVYAKDNGQRLGYASVTLCELRGVSTAKGKPGCVVSGVTANGATPGKQGLGNGKQCRHACFYGACYRSAGGTRVGRA
jgi:hypothetical protein